VSKELSSHNNTTVDAAHESSVVQCTELHTHQPIAGVARRDISQKVVSCFFLSILFRELFDQASRVTTNDNFRGDVSFAR